jgi:hypothetical protein
MGHHLLEALDISSHPEGSWVVVGGRIWASVLLEGVAGRTVYLDYF